MVDRAQAAKYGADVGSVGNMIQMTTVGYKIGTYRPDDSDDEIEIRVRFPREHRTIEELNHVRLNTPLGAVPISNFVDRQAKEKTGTIKRVDGQRVVTVQADVDDGVLVDGKLRELEAWIKAADLDQRIDVCDGGHSNYTVQQFLQCFSDSFCGRYVHHRCISGITDHRFTLWNCYERDWCDRSCGNCG